MPTMSDVQGYPAQVKRERATVCSMKYSLESNARRAVWLSFTRVCSIEDRSQKTKYLRTNQGVDLVGFRVFYFHRLVRRKNQRAFRRNLKLWQEECGKGGLSASKLGERIKGWISYAEHGNSYNLRKRLLAGFTFRKNYQWTKWA